MEQSVSTYKKIRRLYRQSQKYAASRMERSASVTWPTRWASIKP